MNIVITIPAFNPPHGGIRVIIEWANRLSKWHKVTLLCIKPSDMHCSWMRVDPLVQVHCTAGCLATADCLIITSPHSIHLQDHPQCPKKVFIFMQMVEHMFRPNDAAWYEKCVKFYTSPHPMFAISKWNIDVVVGDFGRIEPIYYIGNGVNLRDFPIETPEKDGKTILVEGWEGYNPAKDIDCVGPRVANTLKQKGYTILAYGQVPLTTMPWALDEYHFRPPLAKINELYSRATILLKASRYDARSCSPVEAMTKGTVTVRAIVKGDDDLIGCENAMRCGYEYSYALKHCLQLLNNPTALSYLRSGCYKHVQKYTWDYWMEKINEILCRD